MTTALQRSRRIFANIRRIDCLSCSRGASAIEFALILPVLLLIVMNIFTCAIYLGAAHNLRQLAAEAARASIAGINDAERTALALQSVKAGLASGSLIRPGSIDTAITDDPADPQLYRVTLTFDARSLGLASVPGIALVAPAVLTSSFSVRRGGL